jgi:ankyrin repeat protein
MAEKPLEPLETPVSFVNVASAGAAGDAAHVLSLVAEDAARLAFKDAYGCDALTWGARNSFAPVVSAALGKDADVESKSFGGLRPLHHACQAYSEDIIKELLDKKADPTAKDDAGNTPFHFACRR